MRRSPGVIGLVILFVVLVLLHFIMRPLLAWRAPVDFLLIAVLLVAVRVRPGTAALVGAAAGLAADSLAPSSFGAAVLALTLVAFAASWLKAGFFAEHIALNALFLFVGKLGFDVVYLFAERRLGGTQLMMQLGVWSPLSAAFTALAGLAVVVLFAPLIAGGDRP